jgi:two-component system sensor histidine kinase/response regulator
MGTGENGEHLLSKILIVDDRKENLYAMEKTLSKLECLLYMAESGNDALSLTLRHDFALILLDVNMPEMDGFELAELLRFNEATKHIPIIFVTAINKEDKSIFKGYETGAVDYLFKPIDPDILQSKVKVFLELNSKQKQLEAIQAELERSNQSLKEFAQIVSHDLKNPIHAIGGFTELLMRRHTEGMTDKGKEYVNQIAATAERMGLLVTNLLSYSQINAQPTRFAPVDLNIVLNDVMMDLSNKLESTGGKIEKLNELPVIDADITQMYQLFQNIIGNSIKYHHEGRPPRVTVSCEHPTVLAAIEAGTCRLIIEDNGIGMKQEDVPKIFGAFKRLENAKSFEGTGLGLTTVKNIVDRHSGKIEVESTLGQGSKFLVELRMKR